MRLAKQAGAFTIAIVNVVSSTIAREADGVLYTWAGPEISVATTRHIPHSCPLCTSSRLRSRVCGPISIGDERALCAELQRLPECIEQTLKCQSDMQRIATLYAKPLERVLPWPRAGLCRRARGFAQLKEISLYIHSEAYAAGELKHGTISLIEEEVLWLLLWQRSRHCLRRQSPISVRL